MNFSVKPVFIGWLALCQQLPMQIFFTAWCGGFFGGMLTAARIFPQHSYMPFVIPATLAFIIVPVFTYLPKKLNYQRTEYKFFDDRVEFEEGFFTINKKVIKFKDVKEVTLRKGVLQRMYGLGTIYLATMATGSSPYSNASVAFGFGNISASGVSVRDTINPDEVFEKIKTAVDAQNT